MPDMQSKVALVTGGTSGIGRASSLALAERGVKVAVAGRDPDRGRSAVEQIRQVGGEAVFIEADVRSEKAVERMVGETLEAFGALHFLFNNAGYDPPPGSYDVITEEIADQVLPTNLKGVYFTLRHAIPAMLEYEDPCVVNAGSFLGTIPIPVAALYGATKAGVIHLTASTAAAYGEDGLRIYALCPYVTDTPMMDRVSGFDAEVKAELAKMNPGGRIAEPADVASVVVDLFSGERTAENGAALLVDRGSEVSHLHAPAVVAA